MEELCHHASDTVDVRNSTKNFLFVQVYKSFPFHPRNDTFDPQLSLSNEDVTFLVENGLNVVRLYVAWPGVEPSKGQYNGTYLEVDNSHVTTSISGVYLL